MGDVQNQSSDLYLFNGRCFCCATRITVGLIIGSLIVGAALLMRVETSFRIWGYPGRAIIFFLCAAVAGIVLLLNILFYDKSKDE